MSKAGAGEKSALKSKEELPEWIKVIKEYVGVKKKEENSANENNSIHPHLAISSGLYGLVIQRLKELEKYSDMKSNIIRFPIVFRKLCTSLQITKEQAWELLFLFNDLGFLEIIPYQGIRIKSNKTLANLLRL
jgi:hypothetical protein